MGKFTAIQTYDRFTKLKNANKIDEHSLNFILDTGQLYTHGIFLNNVAWGTETTGAVELTIAGVKKTLSLSNHIHSNYLEKNANIDLGAYKIVSGTKDLLYYSSGNTYLGNTSSPLILQGSSGSIKKGDTTYTILDTLNFTILAVSSAGHSLLNAAKITYGSSSFQIDYIKRLNTTLAFNDLNAYSNAGVTLTGSKYYAFLTLRNDGSDTANWAQLRFDIASKSLQYRTSADSTTWYNVVTSIPVNALNVAGIVTAPTSNDGNKFWGTDSNGNPGWKTITNSLYYLTLNGTVYGSANTTNLGTLYAIPTSDASGANQVWMRNSDNTGYTWRTLGDRAFDNTNYLPLSGGTMTGNISVISKYNFAGDPTGYDYGGLYRNSQITSGGEVTTLWLYSYNTIRILGSSVLINGYTPITSGNIGSQSVNYATNTDTLDGYHATNFLAWEAMKSGWSSAPFQDAVNYFNDLSNLNNGAKLLYSHYGGEYTILFTRRSDAIAHGSILKWGYSDKYIRIIRMISGSAQSTDWEKISAGYADSAGNADTLDGYHYNNLPYLPISGGTMTGTPYINMPASAASISNSQPFGITYGRIQGYGELYINGDTDGSTSEYVHITAGYGAGTSGVSYGLGIGYNNLYWKGGVLFANTSNVGIGTTSPQVKLHVSGALAVIDDSSNTTYDGLAYFRHYSNNDWGIIIDKASSYDYGLDIRASGSYSLRNTGGSRLIGSVIVGADAAPSYTLDVRGTTRSTDRIYSNEWIQFDNWTGLYSPNNGAHFYPNNTTSYGAWQLRGSRNGYGGIHFGDSTHYMTVMDNYTDKGIYQQDQRWILYYNANNGKVSLRDSSDLGADINLIGSVRTNSTYYGYGLYHLSYGSSAYALTSNGGVAHIGSMNVNSATYASSYLANRQSIGSSTHATSLQDYFNNYKSSIPRNCLTANYSSAYGNGSLYMGYFLSGYDDAPYGGFYVCHYNTPYYVGIAYGSFSQQQIITSSSIGSQSVNYANSAGSAGQVTINYNNDSNSTYLMLWGSGNSVYGTGGIYCNPYTDYLYAGSFYCGDWFRSSGSTGWYNESYGGGWYMSDSSWIRSYNNKGVVASGFYHNSYGSSAYALTSDGGVAHIGSMSVNYANSAGSVSWGNISSKPGLVGSSSTPVYWTGSGFGECSVQDSRIVKKELSTGQKWSFQFTRGTFICLIISVAYWNYGKIVVFADGTYDTTEGGYITLGEDQGSGEPYVNVKIVNNYGAASVSYSEAIYTDHICHITMIKDSNWWRDNGIS